MYKIGILYSTSGPYASVGLDCRDGAELAIAQSRQIMPGLVEAVTIDPGANLKGYVEGAVTMLRDMGCRHIIGTVTSAARKEIIPYIEKHDALLWYTCPYEGFEANSSVIYTGTCPNQHLIPMLKYLLPRYGNRPYLAGANYVWGWEMNRLAREIIAAEGGELAGERYLPIEETAVERLIADIERERPSFVLNNLIGTSSYAFIEAMHQLAQRDPSFASDKCPVVSCDLTECELNHVDRQAIAGLLSAASYFHTEELPEDRTFKRAFEERYGRDRPVSAIFAATHAAMTMCLEAIHSAGTDDPLAIRQQLYSAPYETLLGRLRIDPETNHAALPFHLGRSRLDGRFDILTSRPAIAADPYLTAHSASGRPRLKVVS